MPEYDSAFPSIDESARRRFESAWTRGEPESIRQCLASVDDDLQLATLEELICIELELRLTPESLTGNSPPVRIESYLEEFPELAQESIVIRLIEEEYRLRQRQGDRPKLDEYRARFPEFSTAIETLQNLETRSLQILEGHQHEPTPATRKRRRLAPGAEIAGYRLESEFARGGFGRIFSAIDLSLGRTIAIKQLWLGGGADAELEARFLNEARITALLAHPGVVPVYSLYESEEHEPFYTMKLVEGRTLAVAIDELHASAKAAGIDRLKERRLLESILAVIRTMAFAHERRVIHRDLKPANILLGEYGETVILDWGLAKSLDRSTIPEATAPETCAAEEDHDRTRFNADSPIATAALTVDGAVMGTPVYMSPEQATGSTELLDERSDVYALGALLYEALTGSRPFRGASSDAVLKQVIKGPPPPPRSIRRGLPRPIDAICQKAMATDPRSRYRTAAEFASDLERFLADQPTDAHSESIGERIARWRRTHRKATGIAVLALVVIAIVSLVAFTVSDRFRREAKDAEHVAIQQRREAERALADARLRYYGSSLDQATAAWERGELDRAEEILIGAPTEHRGWEWRFLLRRVHGQVATFVDHAGPVMDLAFHPTQPQLLSIGGPVGEPSTVHVWNRSTGRSRQHFTGFESWGKVVAYSPDGSLVFAGGGTANSTPQGGQVASPSSGEGEARVWHADTGTPAFEFDLELEFVLDAEFSPDGSRLAIVTIDDALLFELPSFRLIRRTRLRHDTWPLNFRVRFEASSRFFVVFSEQAPSTFSSTDGEPLRGWPAGAFEGTGAFERTGGLRSGGAQYALPRRNPDDTGDAWIRSFRGTPPVPLAHPVAVTDAAFMPGGNSLLTGSFDGFARLWDVSSRRTIQTIRAHSGRVLAVAWGPDGRWAGTAGADGTVKVWDLRSPHAVRTMPLPRSGAGALALHPEGTVLVDSDLRWLDPTSGEPLFGDPHGNAEHYYSVLRWQTRGKILFGVRSSPNPGESIQVDRFSRTDGTPLDSIDTGFVSPDRPFAAPGPLAFLSDGRWVFCGDWTTVRVYRDSAEDNRFDLPSRNARTGAIATSPSLPYILRALEGGSIELYDVDLKSTRLLRKGIHEVEISELALSHDGKRFATGDVRGNIQVWDAESAERTQTLSRHTQVVTGLRFDRSGSRLFSISHDRTLRVWHVESGLCLLTHRIEGDGDRGLFVLDGSEDDQFIVIGSTTEHVLDGRPLSSQ